MSDASFLEVASSIRKVLHQNLPLNQFTPTHRPTIEQLTPQPPIPQPFVDLSHHVSSWKLPDAVSSELAALIPAESMKYQDVVGRAHLQLLQEIYASCDNMTAASLLPHARAARDAMHARLVNSLLDTVQQLASGVDHENGPASDADESSDSDSSSGSEDEDDMDDEGVEEPEEDENTPMKPGEEVPPLETKYLPIFEALHERGKVLTKPEKTYLVDLTGMTYRQITIWFQNRRRGELKEDMNTRISNYAASAHSDQTSDLSDDELILEKQLNHAQPPDTTFNIRSWRLASALASGDAPPAFPPSPTKVGFTDVTAPHPDTDTDSDFSDSDDEPSRSDGGLRVPSLTTSSATFDSSSDRGPATVGSASSSQVLTGSFGDPIVATEKGSSPEQKHASTRPIKQLPSSRRGSPPAQRNAEPQQASSFNFNFSAPPANPPSQFVSVTAPMQPPQFVTSNERGLTVEMDTTPPRSTITLQSSPSSAQTAVNPSGAPTSSVSPSSPVMPSGSPNSAPSPSPSGNSASSPRPAVKPLPRRTGCAPRPRPPPRAGSIATQAPAPSPAGPNSARSSVVLAPVVLPPSSNPSLAGTTLGALLRPNIPPPSIPPEMEERLTAMAGRMGVGANGQRRNPSTGVAPPRGPPFNFGPSSLPGAGSSPGMTGGATPILPPLSGRQASSPSS